MSRYTNEVRPEVQQKIDRLFHVFGKLGFEKGFPPSATTKTGDNQAMMIPLPELDRNFRDRRWDWAYVHRFGEEFANLLDRKEIERRLEEKEGALQEKIRREVKHWRGKDGAFEILGRENPSEKELLPIILDPKVSPEILTRALVVLLSGGEISKRAKQRILDVFKISQYDVYELKEDRLDENFWSDLPNSVKFALLESKKIPWEMKVKVFFEVKDRDGFAVLESRDVIERIMQILRRLTADQIKELLQMRPKRNRDVVRVYENLLGEALKQTRGES